MTAPELYCPACGDYHRLSAICWAQDPDYLMALRLTHDHAYGCECRDCRLVRERDANGR